jgi:NADH dehydrogenase
MILITGGTGFIGSRIIMRLVQANMPFKVLLRPKKEMAKLPLDLPMDVVVSSLTDRRSLRSVLSGVSTILHFASAENGKPVPDFEAVEVDGTDILMKAAKDAGVQRVLFLSRIGADVNSVYPIFRAKALAEKTIQTSGLDYQILRLSDVFGEGDHFIHELGRFVKAAPGIIPIPEKGDAILQPLWVEDLISSIFILIQKDIFQDKIIPLGGGEFFDFSAIVRMVMRSSGKRRVIVPVAPAYLRLFNLWFQQSKKGFPLSNKWLDLLAINRTCALDSLPRAFDLLPGRLQTYLNTSNLFDQKDPRGVG